MAVSSARFRPAMLTPLKTCARIARRSTSRVRLQLRAGSVDALLVSHPKSGRTWLRFMLANYLHDVSGLQGDVDLATKFTIVPNFDVSPRRGIPAFVGKAPHRPLVCCSHLPHAASLFPRCPVVLLLRDPRDVLTSAFFHETRHKHRFAGTPQEFLADAECGVPALAAFLNSWAVALPARPHLVTSYEALSRRPAEVLAALAAFLAVPVRPAAIDAAVERASFANMRERELAGGIPDHDYDRGDPDSLRMRKGEVGGHTELFSPGTLAVLERELSRRLSARARAMVDQALAEA